MLPFLRRSVHERHGCQSAGAGGGVNSDRWLSDTNLGRIYNSSCRGCTHMGSKQGNEVGRISELRRKNLIIGLGETLVTRLGNSPRGPQLIRYSYSIDSVMAFTTASPQYTYSIFVHPFASRITGHSARSTCRTFKLGC